MFSMPLTIQMFLNMHDILCEEYIFQWAYVKKYIYTNFSNINVKQD